MERYRQTIYCDIDFLKSIMSNPIEKSGTGDSLYDESEMTVNVRNLILSSDVKLYLNMSGDEYDKMLRDIDKKRLKAAKKGEDPELTPFETLLFDMYLNQHESRSHLHLNSEKILFDDDSLLQHNRNYLNAVFFSSEPKETCNRAMNDYGIIVICTETINDFQYLMYDHGAALRKAEESDWGKCILCKNAAVPCNALILIDNYILNDGDALEENLTPLLDKILPKSLKATFELTVFSTLKSDRGIDYDINGRYDKMMHILHTVRPDMKFSLSILKCAKENFHDRNIASGNLFVACGGGFNLFKNGKSQKTTTVFAFHPFFHMHNNWARKAYSDLLNEASAIYKRASVLKIENINRQYDINTFVFGPKQNRLLDQMSHHSEKSVDL